MIQLEDQNYTSYPWNTIIPKVSTNKHDNNIIKTNKKKRWKSTPLYTTQFPKIQKNGNDSVRISQLQITSLKHYHPKN